MEVIVEYNYTAEEPDELTIKKGDIIKEVFQFEEGWYIGNLEGKIGVFPDNFVKVLRPAEASKETGAGALQKATDDRNDDAIDTSDDKPQRVLGIGLGNIFSGKPIQLKQSTINDAKKETAVSQVEPTDTVKASSTRSPVLTDRVLAKFDYQPKQPDELELLVDDVIQILDRSLPDEGWWSGKNLRTRKIGIFPDNFVVPLTSHDENGQAFPFQNFKTSTLGEASRQHQSISSSVQNGTVTPDVQPTRPTHVSTSVPVTSATVTRGNENTKVDWRQSLSTAPSALRSSLVESKTGTISAKVSSSRDGSKLAADAVADVHFSQINAIPQGSGAVSAAINANPKNGGPPNSKLYINLDRTETLERQLHRRGTPNAAFSAGDSPSFTEDLDTSNHKLSGHIADRPKQTGRRLPSKFSQCITPTSEASNDMFNEADVGVHEENNSVQTNQTPRAMPTPTDLVSSVADLTENSRSLTTQRTADHSGKIQRGTPSGAQNKLNRMSSSHLCRSVSPVPHTTGQRLATSTGHHHHHTPEADRRSQSRVDRRWTTMKADDTRATCRNSLPATNTGSLGRGETHTNSNESIRPSESATSKQSAADGQRQLLPKLQAQLERLQTQYDQYVAESKQQMQDMRQQMDQLKNANSQLRLDMIHGQRALTERLQALMSEVDEAKKQQAADQVEHARLRKMLMRLDAKAIMGNVENGPQNSDAQKGSRRHHHHPSGNHAEGHDYPSHGVESHPVNEYEEGDQPGGDSHIGAPIIKVGDATPGSNPQPLMNKANRSANPPPLKARPACINSRTKS